MNKDLTTDHVAEALTRAQQHWRNQPPSDALTPTGITIAISRETGTQGAAVARQLAKRLGWPVYDRELVLRVASDMGVRQDLLESVDERRVGWLREAMTALFAGARVDDAKYFRCLVEMLISLASHGNCIIVGRGAAAALPRQTTLRVRLVAPLRHRIEVTRRETGLTSSEAARRVDTIDRERDLFVSSHFGIDPRDPANFDVVLNVERLTHAESADVIIAAYERIRDHAKNHEPAMAS
jgi:cytidylate kinase